MANKEAKGLNSLSSTSRRNKRYNQHRHQQQQHNNSKVARFNIYETIDTPMKRNNLNRLSSSSTGKLDDAEESKRLLIGSSTLPAGQSSESQLNKLLLLSSNQASNQNFVDQSDSLNCDQLFRRRYQNDTTKFANYQNNSTLRSSTIVDTGFSTNPYSEILTPTTPVPSSSSVVEGETAKDTIDIVGHYQVPSTTNNINNNNNTTYAAVIHHQVARRSPTVNDELNQIIETKRKKTLLLLKSKEAPKASFEKTSPVDEVSSSQATFPPDTILDRPSSSPVLSDYENVSSHNLNSNGVMEQEYKPLNRDVSKDEEEADILSPSESQNFNTLSIVSDVLGDLSLEDHSVVNQLSQG